MPIPRRPRVIFSLVLLMSLVGLISPSLLKVAGIPPLVRLSLGDFYELGALHPFSVVVQDAGTGVIQVERLVSEGTSSARSPTPSTGAKATPEEAAPRGGEVVVRSLAPGRAELELRLLGVPVKRLALEVVPEFRVIPGGQAIGVLLGAGGLEVSKVTPVVDFLGRERSPAESAGIKPGDMILQVDGEPIRGPEQLSSYVQLAGQEGRHLLLLVKRGDRLFNTRLLPVKVGRLGTWAGPSPEFLVGVYLRQPAAGVGTLTFYHPESGRYGALGHMIVDPRGRSPKPATGRIVRARISGIHESLQGRPGEKLGVFQDEQDVVGTVDKNTRFGIFGSLSSPPSNPQYLDPVPVALSNQVREGPAEMLTVLEGQQVERFKIEITKVNRRRRADTRGIVIRITDPRLLRKTKGIVQGMSGSPIIQSGRLIGAVTHVFVNDPARGYGVLAEWMVYEAGLLSSEGKKNQSSAAA